MVGQAGGRYRDNGSGRTKARLGHPDRYGEGRNGKDSNAYGAFIVQGDFYTVPSLCLRLSFSVGE